MTNWLRHGSLMVFCVLSAVQVLQAADVRPQEAFAKRATWSVPTVEDVHAAAITWVESQDETDREQIASIASMWESAQADEDSAYLLDLAVATLAAVDERARQLADVCSEPRVKIALPDVTWLDADETEPFARNNLRLLYGRWLVQERLYDEAQEQLGQLEPADVVDPAALLFYQAVVHHRLLDSEDGLKAIERLLENEPQLPRRYVSVARLMQADLSELKEETLDHIARRMEDIERRLDLGRSGTKVREVEDGVIASLDKLIEEMEKQQQAAAAAAAQSNGPGGARPTTPLPDSRPIEQKGPGQVADKSIGDQSGWGDLPPRARREALQQISKEFPAHYRDMIEQYFRKLAGEGSDASER